MYYFSNILIYFECVSAVFFGDHTAFFSTHSFKTGVNILLIVLIFIFV